MSITSLEKLLYYKCYMHYGIIGGVMGVIDNVSVVDVT